MKYYCIKIDGNYSSIIPYGNGIIKGTHNNEFYYNDFLIASNVDTASGRAILYCNLLFYSSNYKGYCFNLDTLENESLLGSIIFSTYHDNTYLSISDLDENDWSYKLDLLMFKPSKVLLNFPNRYFGSFYRFDNLILNMYRKDNLILLSSLSLITGFKNWQTDLSIYGEIRKIVGVVEDTLWVLMYRAGVNKDEGKLLGMDIITGNITIEINETSFLSDCFVEKIEEKGTLLSIYGKISTKPADSPLIEIDALTGNIIRKQRIASLYQENLKIGLWKYLDGKIYFTASKDYINSTHIGILDYQTLELLWVDEVKERKAGLVDLQVTDTKIYVLDQGKQLHIYEKDTAL